MDNKKLFISIPIEAGLVSKWHKYFDRLDVPKQKIKVVPPENFHITLKFLGYLPLDKLLPIIEVLKPIILGKEEFELTVNKTEIFPTDTTKAPRVLSIGLEANDNLQSLYDEVEHVLWQAGLAHKEPRRFTPHVTMARIKSSAKYEEFKEFINWSVSGRINVNSVQLLESVAGKLGPEYIILENFNF